MNKNRYRLIFNKVRGQLMAVGESAQSIGSAGRGSSRRSPLPRDASTRVAKLRPSVFAWLAALGLIHLLPAHAQIIADPNAPKQQQPTVLPSANGVPVVNIQTPSAAGVSRNTYQQFDVQNQGAILNNGRKDSATALAGWIAGNPWLATGTARIILNEVNATNPSLLNGFIEIAGDKAQFILANPAGISCAGCGVINATQSTFTTGSAQMSNGALMGYRVDGGTLIVTGAGMDTRTSNATHLIARAVELNAGVWANTLDLTLGQNTVRVGESSERVGAPSVLTNNPSSPPAPAFALDVSALGGMYAQKIFLVGTEAGVGVRNAGEMGASVGEVIITADGQLHNLGTISAKSDLLLTTHGLANEGTLTAAHDLRLQSQGQAQTSNAVQNSGRVNAGNELLLTTDGALDNRHGTLSAPRLAISAQSLKNDGGTITQTGRQALTMSSATLTNESGGHLGSAALSVPETPDTPDTPSLPTPPGPLPASPSTAQTGGSLESVALAPPVQVLADGSLTLLGDFDNGNGTLQTNGALALTVQGGVSNHGTLNLDALVATGDVFSNAQGTLNLSNATLTAHTLTNDGGHFYVAQNVNLSAQRFSNVGGSFLHAGTNDLSFLLPTAFDNTDGTLATNARHLTITTETLTNRGGTIEHAGSGTMVLTAQQLDGTRGTLSSQGALNLRAQHAVLNGATTVADQITLTAESLAHQNGTLIQNGREQTVLRTTGQLDNQGGQIATQGALNLSAGTFNNQNGDLQSDRAMTLATGALNNQAGQLIAGEELTLEASALNNQSGTLGSVRGSLSADVSGELDNHAGRLEAHGALTLTSWAFNNTSGTLLGQAITLDTHEKVLNNTSGQILAETNAMLLTGELLSLNGLIQAGHALNIDTHAQALSNRDGRLLSGQNMSLTTGAFNNQSGVLHANGRLSLSTAQAAFDNTAGHLLAGDTITLDSGRLSNQGGLIQTDGRLVIDTHHTSMDNTGGLASATGTLMLATGSLNNQSGQLIAGDELTLEASELNNQSGTLGSIGGFLSAQVTGAVNNSAGHLEAQGALTLTSWAFNNTSGTLLGQAITLDTHEKVLNNTSGQILAETNVALSTGELLNQHGLIQAGHALNIDTHAQALSNRDGRLLSAGSLRADAASQLDNTRGLVRANGALTLTTDSLINQDTQGEHQGIEGDAITLTAREIDNRLGALRGDRALLIQSASHFDNTAGLASAAGTLTLSAGSSGEVNALTISNSGGTFLAGEQLNVDAASLTGDGSLLSHGDLAVSLTSDYTHTGELIANGTAHLTTTGNITNLSTLQGGAGLNLTANTLDNRASGQIIASALNLSSHTLTNRGLINGDAVHLFTDSLINLGTGAIYGGQLAIAANQLTNTEETANGSTQAAVIAARERLDLAVGRLTNDPAALIYSDGDVAIGGALDDNFHATGQASRVTNTSATIEAKNKLAINTAQLTNQKEVFETARVGSSELPVGRELLNYAPGLFYFWDHNYGNHTQWRNEFRETYLNLLNQLLAGHLTTAYRTELANAINSQPVDGLFQHSSNALWQFMLDKIEADHPEMITAMVDTLNGLGFPLRSYDQDCVPPGAGDRCDYVKYTVNTRTDQKDIITQDSAQGIIRSGGDMLINAHALENRYSLIASGGNMSLTGATLTNIGAELYLSSHVATETRQVHWTDWNGNDHDVIIHNDSNDYQTLIGTSPGIISAGGTLSAHFTESINNSTIRQNTGVVTAPSFQTPGVLTVGGITSQTPSALTPDALVGSTTTPQAPTALAASEVERNAASTAESAPPPSTVITITTAAPTLPSNGLFHSAPGSSAPYYLETDPRFTQYKQWLSSDTLLSALSYDPATTQKRLGDGFYEQRLITEQIGQLTGRRFLEGYESDEEQYRALMENGASFAQQFQLIPGVALSEAQMAQLTTDIVWLVQKTVTLPDGSTTTALVPQVYARVRAGDLAPSGALMQANSLKLSTDGDLVTRGTLAARTLVSLHAENIDNLRGQISGRDVLAQAANNLTVDGGQISAERTLLATAGNDLRVKSSTVDTDWQGEHGFVNKTVIDRVAGLYVTGENGTLVAAAGNDLSLLAARVQNGTGTEVGAGASQSDAESKGTTLLSAGNNLTLGTIIETSDAAAHSQTTQWTENTRTEIGSQILADGSVSLIAGADLAVRASPIDAGGALSASAGNDLKIESGEAQYQSTTHSQSSSSTLFSSKSSESYDTVDSTTALSSSLSGNTVLLQAGNDLTVRGSQVVSDLDTTLIAGNDLTLEAAQNTVHETHFAEEKESGFMGTGGGGLGFTVGSREQGSDQNSTQTYATASVVGAINGDVTLLAGADYTQTGSHVLAPGGDMNVLAQNITLQEARETTQSETDTWFKQSGLTVSLSSPILSALQTGSQMVQAAQNTSSTRMQALAAASLGLAAKGAYDSVQAALASKDSLGNKNPLSALAPTLNISLGSSESESHTEQTAHTAAGSSLQAGGDINLIATGAGQDSNILIQGSTVQAGHNVTLLADNQINLLAAQNTASEHSTNESSSSSVGVSINLVTGPSLTLGMSQGEGHGDGDDLGWTNTHVSAGNNVTMVSGGDMNLIGAVVSGKTVSLDVGSLYGGNLVIQSLQDTETYDSDQESSGFNISLGFNLNAFGGSVTAGQSQIESDYASVTETSGIKAGDGGFTVTVQGDTSLIGAVIASTEQAVQENKNSFETGGTLTLTNLENHADYEASGSSVTVGGSLGTDAQGNNPLKPSGNAGMGEDEGHASSTTEAGISGIAGKEDVRTGDAETGIKNTFDKDKVQKEIDAQIAITQSFGQQASKAVGDYAAGKMQEAEALIKQAATLNDADPRAAELIAQAKELESQWGENGTLRLAAHTVIGGLTGGANGALGSLVGTMTASQAAQMLRESGITQESNPVLYNSLVALASTAAGALVGGEMGAGSALNEVVNNTLLAKQPSKVMKQFKDCLASGASITLCNIAQTNLVNQLEIENLQKIVSCIDSGDPVCREKEIADLKAGSQDLKDSELWLKDALGNSVKASNELYLDMLETCPPGQSFTDCGQSKGVAMMVAGGLTIIGGKILIGEAQAAEGSAPKPTPGAGAGVVEKETAGSGLKGGAAADDLFLAAQRPFSEGQTITNAGRAVTKHPEYFGFESTQELRQLYKTDAQLNELASKTLQDILQNGVKTTGTGGRFPNGWITYTLQDGRAASWSTSGEFIGFRGVKK